MPFGGAPRIPQWALREQPRTDAPALIAFAVGLPHLSDGQPDLLDRMLELLQRSADIGVRVSRGEQVPLDALTELQRFKVGVLREVVERVPSSSSAVYTLAFAESALQGLEALQATAS